MKRAGRPRRARSQAIRATKSELERLRLEIERAERDADLQRAAELQYGRCPSSSSSSPSRRRPRRAAGRPGALLKEEVDADDIAEVVAAGPASRSRG